MRPMVKRSREELTVVILPLDQSDRAGGGLPQLRARPSGLSQVGLDLIEGLRTDDGPRHRLPLILLSLNPLVPALPRLQAAPARVGQRQLDTVRPLVVVQLQDTRDH